MRQASNICLGLIGGLGVGATTHYYRALAKAHEQKDTRLRLLMVHADLDRVLGYVRANQIEQLTDYFAAFIERLRNGGADVAAVAAVTPHVCIRELTLRSPLPLVNLLEVAQRSLLGKRIALFGTRFTIETDLFGSLTGTNTIRPERSEVDQIHEAYMRTALRGESTEEERQVLTVLAHRLIQREGVEAIVFAGTDLALLFEKVNTPFPFIDCSQLHINAILKVMLTQTFPSSADRQSA